tara:strand:- start:1164 stop:1868 length:705 start_codon:yes stop_codon:yes gene_type:complete
MKWFKHDANASIDAKLKRVRAKYGMEGYGLYWYLLECISRNVEAHNLTFELEEDAELIAADVGIHREVVEEMMHSMVDMGLFENREGIITCLKMSQRSDEYTAKLLRKGEKQSSTGSSPDSVRTISGSSPDKVPSIRTDRTDKKEKNIAGEPFVIALDTIKITQEQLNTWTDVFPHLDIRTELKELDKDPAITGNPKWFNTLFHKLKYQNSKRRDAKAKNPANRPGRDAGVLVG